jgi:GNAT superfamily N-acetyltransferase
MTGEAVNVACTMVRDTMDDFPQYTLPPGYRFRTYRPGDETAWMNLHYAAEKFFVVKGDLFEREFLAHKDALADRMFMVVTGEDTVVGSITAWWEKDRTDPHDRGRIHWVVVHPDHQGKGISKPMMTRAMARLAESHPAAMLGTSTGRTWALKVYLDFGFYPDPAELEAKPDVLEGWRDVATRFRHPRLESTLAPFGIRRSVPRRCEG